jgi:hypothetical protein
MKKLNYTFEQISSIFGLDKLYPSEIMKQYKDFRRIPYSVGEKISLDESHNVILENALKTIPPEETKTIVSSKFQLSDWQITVELAKNDIKVLSVIADIGNNKQIFIDAMSNLGWFLVGEDEVYINVRSNVKTNWIVMCFDPMFQNDVSNKVMEREGLLHWTPLYNYEEIKKNGLIPKSENKKGSYPERIYFFGDNRSFQDDMKLGRDICNSNKDSRNDGRYVLLYIKTENLRGIQFYYDPHAELCYYTNKPIPSNVINVAGGYNFFNDKKFNVD